MKLSPILIFSSGLFHPQLDDSELAPDRVLPDCHRCRRPGGAALIQNALGLDLDADRGRLHRIEGHLVELVLIHRILILSDDRLPGVPVLIDDLPRRRQLAEPPVIHKIYF